MTHHPFAHATATLILLVGLASSAQAYVGPGAGISLIGSVIGLVAAIGTAIAIMVMAPLRAARRKAKAKAASPPQNM